jgi:HD-like signal output (HDOD) protein
MANRRRLLAAVPPFRPVAVQLLRLVDSPPQDLARIVALLRSDAVLAADMMRAANSPLFGSRYEIANPLQALAYLGLERVKALVLTAALKGLADATHSSLKYACWRHNLATALICKSLSPSADLPAEECYMAGLIHDIGRLALLVAFPEYESFGMLANTGAQDLLAAEEGLFELNHAEAGRWLLSQWGCPMEMQNVAAFHESPAEAPDCDRPVIGLVHAGSQLADLMGMSAFPSAQHDLLPEIVADLSEIAGKAVPVDIAAVAEWVASRVNGIESSLV